jgi:hypothetical protein
MTLKMLQRWPVVRQIVDGGDGTGPEAMSDATDVVPQYDQTFNLRLTPTEINNLVEYLKSL